MKSFRNKVVWITGASSGLGAALTFAFDKEGALLILSSRRLTDLEKISAACQNAENIYLLPFDLEEPDSFEKKCQLAIGRFGRIDILVNNAGVSQRSLAAETDMTVYRKIMETNFFGPVGLSKLLMTYFQKTRSGQFVIISSLTGRVGLPLRTAYSASKFALEGFWNSWITETNKKDTGVKVLIVRPGAIRTPIAENALTAAGRRFDRKDPMIEKGIDPHHAAGLILKAIRLQKKTLFIGSAGAGFLLLLNQFWPAMARLAARMAVPDR